MCAFELLEERCGVSIKRADEESAGHSETPRSPSRFLGDANEPRVFRPIPYDRNSCRCSTSDRLTAHSNNSNSSDVASPEFVAKPIQDWIEKRQEYNEERPHGALNQITPAAYAAGVEQEKKGKRPEVQAKIPTLRLDSIFRACQRNC